MDFEHILQTFYGIHNPKTKKLEGYDSLNFHIRSDAYNAVLKIHDNDGQTQALLDAEHKLLQRLSAIEGQEFPKVFKTKTGESMVSNEEGTFRILSFVEGEFLAEVSHTPSLFRSFGNFIGKMNKELLGAFDPVIAAKVTRWDLQHCLVNREYLSCIADPMDRTLVDYFFLQFEEHVLPRQYELRKGIIHNDANDWNVLTKGGKVSGIIDFGDMCYAPVINDLAIALTYAMFDKEDPLQWAIPIVEGFHEAFPLKESELDVLYYLIAGRLCTSVCNSAYTKQQKPDSEYITVSEKSAWKLLHQWIAINPLKAQDTFRKACRYPSSVEKDTSKLANKRNQHLSAALSTSYERPIPMMRSALQYMYDAEGNTFLDAYNNIMQVGHCHPSVVRAGQKAMATLNTNTRYLYDSLTSYAEKLLDKFPPSLNKVFFVNSGSAASDLAIRLAKTHTNLQKVMVIEHGYHGNTQMGISISHYKYNHKGGSGRQSNTLQTPLPDTYNGPYRTDDGTAGKQYAKKAIVQIDEHKDQIAAFIAEPIVGCGGQVPLAKDYLKEIYPVIRAQGGLCISDEVQVGFGRLGDHFWGFEMHEVVPDIVVLGKPMGNGHPIGAVVTTEAVAKSFENGMEFFSSFGGNPVSCAVGEAVLDVIETEGLQQVAKEVGNYFMEKLRLLQKQYPVIGDVRGSGMFIGIEMVDEAQTPNTALAFLLKNELRNRHILVSTDGPHDNVIKIKGPLYFNKKNVDHVIDQMNDILSNT